MTDHGQEPAAHEFPVERREHASRCQNCGAQPDPATPPGRDGLPWTWSIGTDDRQRRTALCASCARQHARSIEARLDEDWW